MYNQYKTRFVYTVVERAVNTYNNSKNKKQKNTQELYMQNALPKSIS